MLATRVLHVITRLARGGAERRLYDVIRAVPAEHVVAIGRDSHPVGIEDLLALPEMPESRLVRCPDLIRSVEPRSDLRAYRHLLALMREGSFDVVHTHESKAGLLGRVAARQAGVPLVYHSASMASFGPGYGPTASFVFAGVERASAPLVSRYFVVGRDLANRLAANGVSRRRLEVIRSSQVLDAYTPATPDEVTELRLGLGVDPHHPVVCYVGALDDRKGVVALPDLIRGATSGPVTLLVAGDGPRRAELEARARDPQGRLDLRLLGHVRGVGDVIRASDVLALPSSAEGLPQVLVQSARCGVPFVSYDVDGARELRQLGAPGRVAPLGDAAAFTAALAALLNRPESPQGADAATTRDRRDRWASWDPAYVERQYLRRYEQDLGVKLARQEASGSAGELDRRRCRASQPAMPVELAAETHA